MASPMHELTTVHRRKRVRFSDLEPSTSARPPLRPTQVDVASGGAGTHDTESESELSESSEEPSDMSSSDDESDDDTADPRTAEIINVRANRGEKPVMKLDQDDLGPDIRTFLKDFLPQLKAANEELEAQKKAGKLRPLDATEDEDGEQYIEMNLGLGVLEDRGSDANESSDAESDSADGNQEKDVLGKLMGQKRKGGPANIEVVQDEQRT